MRPTPSLFAGWKITPSCLQLHTSMHALHDLQEQGNGCMVCQGCPSSVLRAFLLSQHCWLAAAPCSSCIQLQADCLQGCQGSELDQDLPCKMRRLNSTIKSQHCSGLRAPSWPHTQGACTAQALRRFWRNIVARALCACVECSCI